MDTLLDQELDITSSMEEVEEALFEAKETDAILPELEQLADEAARTRDNALGLEALCAISTHIKTASPTELALVGTGLQMALAGTDLQYDRFVPSLESYRDKTISMEGIKKMAEGFWKTISDLIIRIWERVTDFFARYFSVIGRYKTALEILKKKFTASKENDLLKGKKADKLKMNFSFVNRLLAPGQRLTGNSMYTAVSRTVPFFAFFSADYPARLGKLVDSVEKELSAVPDFTKTAFAEHLADFNKLMIHQITALSPSMSGTTTAVKQSATTGYTTESSYQMAGSTRIIFTHIQRIDENAEPGKVARDIVTGTYFRIRGGNLSSNSPHRDIQGRDDRKDTHVNLESFSKAEAISLADELIKICDHIQNMQRGSAWRAIHNKVLALLKTGDKAIQKADNEKQQSYVKSNLRVIIDFAGLLSHSLVRIGPELVTYGSNTIIGGIYVLKRLV